MIRARETRYIHRVQPAPLRQTGRPGRLETPAVPFRTSPVRLPKPAHSCRCL